MAEPHQTQRVSPSAGRKLLFLAVLLFMGLWTWYFATALMARQYSWSFWSLLLFALFLLALTITPRGRASRVELGLASARFLVDYEAPREAEAVVERVKEALPPEAKPAFERVKPKLLEETRRALLAISEKAALQALSSSSSAQIVTGSKDTGFTWTFSNPLTWEDLEDPARAAAIRRRMESLLRKPTDQSSGSAR